jgi:Hemerythrin HHE cation binding domain
MSRARPKPDLTLVTLIHQSLRADAARLAATIAELGPSDRRGRLPGVQAFFGQYREQLALHHSHEDVLFFAALADPASDFTADRAEAASALSAMARVLDAHLRLEEQTAIPLFESDMPAADYKKLEARARKATTRPQAQFLVPWVVAHATPGQRKALFKSAPPLRVAHWLTRRRYRRLDQALARPA